MKICVCVCIAQYRLLGWGYALQKSRTYQFHGDCGKVRESMPSNTSYLSIYYILYGKKRGGRNWNRFHVLLARKTVEEYTCDGHSGKLEAKGAYRSNT